MLDRRLPAASRLARREPFCRELQGDHATGKVFTAGSGGGTVPAAPGRSGVGQGAGVLAQMGS